MQIFSPNLVIDFFLISSIFLLKPSSFDSKSSLRLLYGDPIIKEEISFTKLKKSLLLATKSVSELISINNDLLLTE